MDPLTALALTVNIFQFVEYGIKLFKLATEIYNSPKGCSNNTDTIEQYSSQVLKSIDVIGKSQHLASSHGYGDDIRSLLNECNSIAGEVRTYVENMRTKTGRGRISSLRKALLSMASRGHIEDLLKRLQLVREGIML